MKSKFDERYDIRIAEQSDIDNIMNFIGSNWKKGHIMAINRSFFEYEFLEPDGTVNFLLAIDKERQTIESINGFLKASHDREHLDIWGSFLKTLDGNMGMLGMELIKRRPEIIGCRHSLGVGDNPNTAIPLFRILLHRYVGRMNHYYMLSDVNEYKIAKIYHKPIISVSGEKQYNIIRINSIKEIIGRFDFERVISMVPYKDAWYINHRFFAHPIYSYEIYGIEVSSIVEAIFILRKQWVGDRYAIRMVDYIGEQKAIAGTHDFFKDLLSRKECEYIDFYCKGFEEKYLWDAGFVCRNEKDMNIIPNYFEPFVQKNVDIWVNSTYEGALFVKADGDQDRPNSV